MIMSASTTLVTCRDAFFKMRRFTYFLNTVVTLLFVIVLIPPVFYFIAEKLIGLPHKVASLTHNALIFLLPWPAAIGYRRFYQGILIRNNLTRRVAYGTIVRLIFMSITAFVLFFFKMNGALVGAAALAVGVIMEAIASRVMANKTVKHLLSPENIPPHKETPLTYRFITKFYYPLALMSIIYLGAQPLITFFIGKSRMALESLAVMPVINGLVFVFRSLGISYMEAVVALLGKENKEYIPLRNFAFMLFAFVVGGLAFIAFTPVAAIWFQNISGLSLELSSFSHLPTQVMTITPGLVVLLSLQRGVLVNSKKTSPITWTTIIEVGTMIAVMFIAVTYFDFVGATAVAWAYVFGSSCANIFILPFRAKAIRESKPTFLEKR
jgi:progressive ankylosis protein